MPAVFPVHFSIGGKLPFNQCFCSFIHCDRQQWSQWAGGLQWKCFLLALCYWKATGNEVWSMKSTCYMLSSLSAVSTDIRNNLNNYSSPCGICIATVTLTCCYSSKETHFSLLCSVTHQAHTVTVSGHAIPHQRTCAYKDMLCCYAMFFVFVSIA